jgi:hypothetical protein
MKRIHLLHEKYQWWALVNMVIILRVPQKTDISCKLTRFRNCKGHVASSFRMFMGVKLRWV